MTDPLAVLVLLAFGCLAALGLWVVGVTIARWLRRLLDRVLT